MPILSAAMITALLATPIVQVTPDGLVETTRTIPMEATLAPVGSGIDAAALNDFVAQAAKRYQGF
jgi:hypothetical protein